MNYVGSSPTIGIFLYVAQAVECVLAVAFRNKLCWFESHYRHISLSSPGSWTRASSKWTKFVQVPRSAYYVAQAVERVLAVAFGNELCWFKSHYWHIFLCSPGSWTCASSSLRKWTTWSVQKVSDLNFYRLNKSSMGSVHHCRCGGDIYAHAWIFSRLQ